MLSFARGNSRLFPLVVAAVAVLALLLFYQTTLKIVVQVWNGVGSESDSHGWLVFVSVLYLLFEKRAELVRAYAGPSVSGWLMLWGGMAMWFAASVAQVQAVQLGALPVILLGMFWSLGGVAVFRTALLPISLLLFALPIWQPLLPVLQDITTAVAHFNLKLTGRPVYVEGNIIHVSGGTFIIEEACSGLRFLLVSTILSLMNSELSHHSRGQAVKFMLLAWGLSLLANWIRVLVVVLLGDFTRMQHPWVNDHANFGWGLYLVTVLIPFFIFSRRAEIKARESGLDGSERRDIHVERGGRQYILMAITLGSLALAPLALRSLSSLAHEGAEVASPPAKVREWSLLAMQADSTPGQWMPMFVNYSARYQAQYRNLVTGEGLSLAVVYYQQQTQGAELISTDNEIVDGEDWKETPESRVLTNFSIPHAVWQVDLAGRGSSKRAWYWYNVGGFPTVSSYEAKINQLIAFVMGRQDASLIAVSVDCKAQCDGGEDQLADFINALPADFPVQSAD